MNMNTPTINFEDEAEEPDWDFSKIDARKIPSRSARQQIAWIALQRDGWRKAYQELTAQMEQILLDTLMEYQAARLLDPHEDAPLKLEQAVNLPELLNQFAVKTLRSAIDRGELGTIRVNSKNIYVSRKQIQEWVASCRDTKRNPTLSNVPPATTMQASSRMRPSGSSMTAEQERARDAALMILKELK